METKMLEVRFTKDEVRDVYRKKASIYDLWATLTESKARSVGLSKAAIQDGESILEVAVGTGLMFREILTRNPHGKNEGIDLTDAMLEKAREKALASGASNFHLQIGDAYNLPFPNASFDLLVNNYMFDLLPDNDFDNVIREFRRVLKPSGRLLLINMTIGEKIWERFFEFVAQKRPALMGACRGVLLSDHLTRAGFHALERTYVSQLGFPSEILTVRMSAAGGGDGKGRVAEPAQVTQRRSGGPHSTRSSTRLALKRAWKALSALAILGVITIAGVAAFGTTSRRSRQIPVAAIATPIAIDIRAAAERLGSAVRIETVSHDGRPAPDVVFHAFHALLARSFPQAHAVMRREIINGSSLFFTWEGREPSLKPIVLMAHQDVVPVESATVPDWQHPPFAGVVAEGHVWGRGAWDDKGNLMSMMEAVETLARSGYQPRRTIYFAFGHDEETGSSAGREGARRIALLLKQRGIHPSFVLDEGLLITQGMVRGVQAPVARIGLAEKGFLTVELVSHAIPGHSSVPPDRTAIGSLSLALTRIEQARPAPQVTAVVREMFETLAPESGLANRILLSNLWLTERLVAGQLTATPAGRGMLQTTSAITVIDGGEKVSTLPGQARAFINLRLLPGDTTAAVIARLRRIIADDQIDVKEYGLSWDASPISRSDVDAYALIHRTIREAFPGTVVAPGLMLGFTDSHHFNDVADNVYRFSPVRTGPDDLSRFHGTNERVSLANYEEMIRFYHRLLSSAGADQRSL